MASPSEDPIICYCFGTTRDEVREAMARPGARLEDVVAETLITTKCTACTLDLDVLLDEIMAPALRTGTGARRAAARASWPTLKVDRVDSGFFVNEDGITTSLRLANYSPMFGDGPGAAAHDWRLWLFSEDGRLLGRRNGRIERDAETTIPLAETAAGAGRGWFLLDQHPRDQGYYGTLRPQCVLEARNWMACYHTQFHADGTRAGRRSAAPARVVDGRTCMLVSVINGANRPARVRMTAYAADGSWTGAHDFVLPARGASLVDIDKVISTPPADAALTIRFESDRPTRKNLIVRQPDGRWNVDHFPNMQ